MDEKHRIEEEKNSEPNRHARLQEGIPSRYPLAIALELSNDCNSECFMCPRKDLTRPVGAMAWETFTKVIDELAHEKVLLRKLFFHWLGEPLLNERFDEMISYAKAKNIAEMLVMASNIIALDEEKARRLIASGLDELFVSLDAVTPESYAKIKRCDYDLKHVEDNLMRLVYLKKEMGSPLPYVRLKILKSDINANEISEFKSKWEESVDEIYVEEDINTWNGTDDEVNSVIGEDSMYKERVDGGVTRWPCNRLWYQVAISHDGHVSPCIADWNGSGFLGNIKNDSLFSFWNSEGLVEMRRKQLDSEYDSLAMCKNCNRWIYRTMGDWMIKHREKALGICRR